MLSWSGGCPIHAIGDSSKSERLGADLVECNHRCRNWFAKPKWFMIWSLSPWSVSLGSIATNQTSLVLWTCPLRTLPGELNSSGNRVGISKLKSQSETSLWRLVTIFVSPAKISKMPSWASMQLTIQSLSIKTKTASMLGWGVSRKRKRSRGISLQRLRAAACSCSGDSDRHSWVNLWKLYHLCVLCRNSNQ